MTYRPTPWMRNTRPLETCVLAAALAAALSGCPATADQVHPPPYDFYFPTGVAIAPGANEDRLFIISANSDLRYGAGALHVIDLTVVDEIAARWAGGQGVAVGGCAPVLGRPKVLSCATSTNEDGTQPASYDLDGNTATLVVPDGVAQIGNFGVALAAEALDDGTVRVFSTVRGDPSITWADLSADGNHLDCGGPEFFRRCDQDHRLTRAFNDDTLDGLGAEPFGISVDGVNGRAYATDLTSGVVSLIKAPRDGRFPILQSFTHGLWSINNLDGTLGAVGVATRDPSDPHGLVYVTSRSEARVVIVHPVDQLLDPDRPQASLVRTGSFFYSGLASSGDAGDARNLIFTDDGKRALILSRTPPSLQLFDTSLDLQGSPRNVPLGVVEICSQPANLALTDFGEGLRVAIPCFGTGQLWVVDPDSYELVAIEDSGRGPSGVAVSKVHKKIYVANYAEDTITVIDAEPGSPTQFRAVLRLGRFRVVGNN